MATYLIPKSARNVKLQLFRGLGITEALMIIFGVLGVIVIFYTKWHYIVQIGAAIILSLLVLFLVSPSFIANKKGYQSFEVIFNFWSSHKKFKKKKKKK